MSSTASYLYLLKADHTINVCAKEEINQRRLIRYRGREEKEKETPQRNQRIRGEESSFIMYTINVWLTNQSGEKKIHLNKGAAARPHDTLQAIEINSDDVGVENLQFQIRWSV